jgi:hypothetical protein
MTSRVLIDNALRARVVNHLWVNKTAYVDPSGSTSTLSAKRIRFNYSWKPDKAEAHRIKRLSKGYASY